MRRFAALGLLISFGLVVLLGGLQGTATRAMDTGAGLAQQGTGFELGGQIMSFLYPNEMRSAGMTWLKMQVVWNRGGSTADAQNVINHARRHGFKVLLSIKGNKAELAVNQQQYYQDYANFVAAVARLNPDAIEIWNEPNIDREWPAGLIHGGVYTQLLSRAYTAIKAANPNVMVISGAPAPTGFFGGGCATAGCDDKIFIEQMAAAGAAQYFDCTGMHYNEGVLPPSATSGDPRGSSGHYSRYYSGMVNTYRAVFPSKPLCFTELGYLSPEGLGSLPAGFEWGANTSRQEQAEWLAQAAALSRDGGVVRLMVVWNVDASIYNADPMAGWSIIRNGSCLACATLGATMGVGSPTPTPVGPEPPQAGLKGEYFDNIDFTNLRVTRVDPVVDFVWDQGIPASGVGADTFSVRWTGQIAPQFSETYTFYTTSDDGVRLWINGQLLINNWTDHAPVENSGTIALIGGQRYDIRLEYYENALGAQIQLRWSSPSQPKQTIPQSRLYSGSAPTSPTPTPVAGNGTGLTGQYFDNRDFTNLRLTRIDPTINLDWGNGSPATGIGPDTFSVRWTGRVLPQFSETYTFYTTTDDGVRLWVNGQLIINNWNDYPPTENRGAVSLVAGQHAELRLEYYENGGGASARLEWSSPSRARQIVPTSQLFPATSAPPTATATSTATFTPTMTPTATHTATPSLTPTMTQTPTATSTSGVGTGLTGEYYDNRDFTGLRLTRTDPIVNFNWDQQAPDARIGADTFSVRWTGRLVPTASGVTTFYTVSDDGVRLWVNGQLLIDNWTDHAPTENSGSITLTAGQPVDIRLDYYENALGAIIQLLWTPAGQAKQVIPQSQLLPRAVTVPTATATPVSGGSGTGLTGQYFDNLDLTALRLTRVDSRVDFNWGRNAPVSGIGVDTFSVRWTGQIEPLYSETYTFTTYADDGTRLWINGQLIIDDWTDHSAVERTGTITLEAGRRYEIRLEYYDNGEDAIARLSWASPRQAKQVVPQTQLYPATSLPPPTGGLLGEYFNTEVLTQRVFTRVDSGVNFDWGSGSPRSDMGPETFSARWTGQVIPLYSETYTFYTVSDDGVRLWVNGQQLINNWTLHAPFEDRGSISLQAGVAYDVRLEFFENGGGALIQLLWSSPKQPKQIIPGSQLRPAVAPSALVADADVTALREAPLVPELDAAATATTDIVPAVPEPESMANPTSAAENVDTLSGVVGPASEPIDGQQSALPPAADQVVVIPTMVPTATPTFLAGEQAASALLCEAATEQGGIVFSAEQMALGGTSGASITGLRFCGVAVPPGARVVSAWVELTPVDTTATPLSIALVLDDAGHSEMLTSGPLLSQRPTLSGVDWQPEAWFGGLPVRTPDLAPLFAQLASRSDWAQGNSVTVMAIGRDLGSRQIWSRIADATLVVRYMVEPTFESNADPTVPEPTAETPALFPDGNVPTSAATETPSDALVAEDSVVLTPASVQVPDVTPELTSESGA